MVEYRNECVDCPPEIGCMGSSCPYRNVPYWYCDECGRKIPAGNIHYDFGCELCDACYDGDGDEGDGDEDEIR